jgi:flagellin
MGLERTLGRLTSGLRINSAADDAAGLAVANRHRLDNSGLQVGIRSSNDAISKLQIEDGAMNNITALLDRALGSCGTGRVGHLYGITRHPG